MIRHPQSAPQFFEHNTAALGLISVQGRLLGNSQREWESRIGSADSFGMKRCVATNDAGIPHGIAGDVFAALLTQAQIEKQNGLPFNQLCMTTSDIVRHMPSEKRSTNKETGEEKRTLAKVSKVKDRHPATIERALLSLSGSVYKIESGWYDTFAKRRRGAQFSLIDSVSWDVTDHLFNAEQSSRRYIIRMNQDIVHSLHSGLVLALDPTILSKLPSPTARGLFRMLEAQRRQSEDINDIKANLALTIGQLAEDARLLTPRREGNYLLKLMAPSFDKLAAEGYLTRWGWSGKGDAIIVTFDFAADGQTLNTAAANRLAAYKVKRTVADLLAQAHDGEEIDCSIWLTEKKVKADPNIKNPPGLCISLLKSGEARDSLQEFRSRDRPQSVPKVSKAAKPARIIEAEVKQPESPRISNRTFISLWTMNKLLTVVDAAFLNARNDKGDFDQPGLASIAALGLTGPALKNRVRGLLILDS